MVNFSVPSADPKDHFKNQAIMGTLTSAGTLLSGALTAKFYSRPMLEGIQLMGAMIAAKTIVTVAGYALGQYNDSTEVSHNGYTMHYRTLNSSVKTLSYIALFGAAFGVTKQLGYQMTAWKAIKVVITSFLILIIPTTAATVAAGMLIKKPEKI